MALAGCLLGCLDKPTYAPRDNIPPDIDLREVSLRQFRGSTLSLQATAPHVQVMRYNANLWVWDAGVSLPRSGVELTAVSAAGNLNQQFIEGSQVTFATDAGLVGSSPRVLYERAVGASGGASSDAGVQLRRAGGFQLEARGFTLDFASQEATLDQPRTVSGAR